jgi:CRP/FNR family transcriptional regulator, cyclic AMP receptor protein
VLECGVDWPLLDALGDAERAGILAAARRRTFGRGEVVFHEDDPADSLHLVVSGHLAVRVSSAQGDTAILNVLGPGATFGELSLVSSSVAPRSATIVCLEPVETRVITAMVFEQLRRTQPAVDRWLADLLGERVRDLSVRVHDLMFMGLERRVYHGLGLLADLYGGAGEEPVVVPLTQEHLADFVGGSRPTVNQVLQRLVAQGVVELGRGRFTVLDRTALRRKAGRP